MKRINIKKKMRLGIICGVVIAVVVDIVVSGGTNGRRRSLSVCEIVAEVEEAEKVGEAEETGRVKYYNQGYVVELDGVYGFGGKLR